MRYAPLILLLLCSCAGGTRPRIHDLHASPAEVELGSGTTLTWVVTDAAQLRLEPGAVNVTGKTKHTVFPTTYSTYTLYAINGDGCDYRSVVVPVYAQR